MGNAVDVCGRVNHTGQGWKMALKKPSFLGFLKNLKNLKSPKFRVLKFFFGQSLYRLYLI